VVCCSLEAFCLVFNFEVALKKISKNKLQQKNRKRKRKNKQQQKRLYVCFLFVSAVVLCDYLCV
jgi:hypothetical protein